MKNFNVYVMRCFVSGRSALRKFLRKRRFSSIYGKFKDYTMVGPKTYVANLEVISRWRPVGGAVVECGTWRGGMIGGIAFLLGSTRDYWLFDSFEGLPEARVEVDGIAAVKWQTGVDPDNFHNNCTADESAAREAMHVAGIGNPHIIKGWFSESLQTFDDLSGIALLRLDGDWYDSTMDILKILFPQVKPGGLIVVDDYYTWDGCARALHDYLSQCCRPERIREHNGICFLVKDAF